MAVNHPYQPSLKEDKFRRFKENSKYCCYHFMKKKHVHRKNNISSPVSEIHSASRAFYRGTRRGQRQNRSENAVDASSLMPEPCSSAVAREEQQGQEKSSYPSSDPTPQRNQLTLQTAHFEE